MRPQPQTLTLICFCLLGFHFYACRADEDEQQSINRGYNSDEIDEGSCICGLNKGILNKIEAIVSKASKQEQSCSIFGGQASHDGGSAQTLDQILISTQGDTRTPSSLPTNASINGDGSQGTNWENLISKLTDEIQALQAQLAAMKPQSSSQRQDPSSSSSLPIFGSMWRPNEQQQSSASPNSLNPQPSQQTSTSSGQIFPASGGSGGSSSQTTSDYITKLNGNNFAYDNGNNDNNNAQKQQGEAQALGSGNLGSGGAGLGGGPPPNPTFTLTVNGFLQGLPSKSFESSSSALNQPISSSFGVQTNGQLGSSSGPIQVAEVQNTLETTVPNVVSNIFSSIQSLAIQTESDPNAVSSFSNSSANFLTSIDGSSVHLNNNDTTEQITAQGEQLFLQWIDHQIQVLHMTASMASYIRKSALSLFRRIARQYVERITRVGGRVEDNVRKATQIALNNTQNLISFLLRNYLNVAGGLMQIIGEQVSRVGKQLDSTGETIAHINLNPFDIVSNVISSLPNPSDYSEYFRAFGKYLMGETQPQQLQQGESNDANQQPQPQQLQEQDQQSSTQQDRKNGLFSKTMGALSKTLGSWIG